MKTFQDYADEYGTVHLKSGEELALIQMPYADYCSIDGTAYWASAISRCSDTVFNVRWSIVNDECEDESDACDWNDYSIN